MKRVRVEINHHLGKAGDEVEVDETDPEVAGMLRTGLLMELEGRGRFFCLECDPPTFYDTAEDLAAHRVGAHETKTRRKGVGDGVAE